MTPLNSAKPNPILACQVDAKVQDGQARFEAIHLGRSFIVQAPAGSGKTALLTQRYLALLSQVDSPEQIVAMTFTKKAAAEMRERIFKSLALALKPLNPEASVFEQNTWHLSQAALQRNTQQGWDLLKNPNRLRIRTIDSMNGYLVQQMPLLSRLGTQVGVGQNNDEIYRQAARDTFKDTTITDAVGQLLQLVNGRYHKAENLLVDMLKKRDQWMKHLIGVDLTEGKRFLESALSDMVNREARLARAQLSNHFDLLNEALTQADFAFNNDYAEAEILIGVRVHLDLDDLAVWRALGNWMLTNDGTWRKPKGVTKNQGFPAGKADKAAKDAFCAVLDSLNVLQADTSAKALDSLRNLPNPNYEEQEWQSLAFLIELLNRAVLHLKLNFQQSGQADFIEIAQAANYALGDAENPTDLAQQLDYQIKHLLIDEFQDTSVEQFDLLKKLTAGWAEEDGHTLFIVGDPMQSIYRFREAEVGNFLQAWQGSLGGAGQVSLTPLNLTENFRSQPGVVHWVNSAFAQVLPKQDNIQLGAVKFTAATVKAFKDDEPQGEVVGHWGLNWTVDDEKQAVLAELKSVYATLKPGETIGVLGRSRSHLLPLALALKNEKIPFRAVELEGLASRQEIQDVLALTRALLHLNDRPAWIALLRSPLVGLSLAQLYELLGCNDDYFQTPVWQSLVSSELQTPALGVLKQALDTGAHLSLVQRVRSVWLQLDGPQTLPEGDSSALQNVEAYWQLLESLEQSQAILDVAALDKALEVLYAEADASIDSAKCELMTMHKSKGLEFDFVFLPGLGKPPKSDDTSLISWLRFANEAGEDRLILAPIHQRGKSASSLTELIKGFESQKQTYEMGRLLYVAVTRAKQACHLFGSAKYKDVANAKGDVQLNPASNSLLSVLWPVVKTEFDALVDTYVAPEVAATASGFIPKVLRLEDNRAKFTDLLPNLQPLAHPAKTPEASSENSVVAPSQSPDNLLKPLIGTLVHQVLDLLAQKPNLMPELSSTAIEQWLAKRHGVYGHWLAQEGLSQAQIQTALHAVEGSLTNALSHEKCRWALSDQHPEAASELALSSRLMPDEAQQNHIVDRTWVDESGKRWILDYKTAALPEGQTREAFIAGQLEHYEPQLARYGALFNQLENRPQQWVLYFTALNEWVEF
ncbi:UvrD-helicase domain-containing protein [Thiosulfativibrio zosterae]|uniref:DNA 3'-5' helicase n=1 Tax=Thiosulfativibrio zosterae TaxID=2675053 RepID=A0A6F8PKY3_9GAMM|nr:UvrD-helicase domain-containing protein [Thiosulfativibrio zosterae]BBP42762.1 ATP-dependent helicase [Thiosulfativibrio zosterae]